jgi:tRNA pseudouridine38-40 synthase
MFAHFDFEGEISEKLVHQLNSFLPPSIAVKRIFKVKNDFHARFDATYRTYEYYISLEKNPFSEKLAWQHWRKPLDVEKMNEACKILLNILILKVLRKLEEIIKPIFAKSITQIGNKTEMNLNLPFLRIDFSEIWCNSWYNGRNRSGKLKPTDLRKVIEAKNRNAAGTSGTCSCALFGRCRI